MMMNARRVCSGLALLALGLTGCSTGPSAATTPGTPPDPWRTLTKGMTATQVRAALGKPDEVRPMASTNYTAEVWTYRRTIVVDVGYVPMQTQDLPATNPMTGQPITVQNPVYTQETKKVAEELQLLLVDGQLVSLKRGFHGERSYD